MTDHDDVQRRSKHTAPSDTIRVREVEVDGDDADEFVVRMPITSTGEARDGEAFSRNRVEGFRDQISRGGVGVFIDHGRNVETGSRYSALGKVGRLAEPELVERDSATDLDVDFRFPQPDEVDDGAETLREVLATLYTQARAGIPLTSSIGWSEDTGDRDVPGDADMLEASVVGIPSDPRTTTASAEPATLARAVSAASSDFDVAAFVRELTVDSKDVVEVGGEEIDITPPEAVENACALALSKKEEYSDEIGDCGTGDGEETAQRVVNGDLTAEYIADEIAAYLDSHEEDVDGIDQPPTDWGVDTWTDGCGPVQFALWGGTATGTGHEWATGIANDVAEALGEELPYPERAARNLDNPEFDVGDDVMWSSNDTPVHGRVADIGDEFEPADGVVITGDDGEAVYLIHEYDDSLEPPQYRRENVAKPESSLDESTMDLPPTDGNFADEENDMSDSETNEPDEESGADNGEQDLRGMEEKMDEVREMCERMESMQEEMYEEMMGGDGEDGEDDGETEESDADISDDEERTVTLDGEEMAVDEARDQIADLREEAAEAEPAEPKTQDRAEASEDGDGGSDTESDTSGFGMAARAED